MNTKPLRALISVSDKTDIVDFSKALADQGIEILSTGGTARLLADQGICVKEVSEHTGFPEMMDGRVKTLHPIIHGGILGRRGIDDQVMAENGIGPIDLVVVNLYPFQQTIADPDCSIELAIENIDIGGPTMLRAAAKNYSNVAVIVDSADYPRVLEDMDKNKGEISETLRFDLAVKAFEHTARYDGAVANYLGSFEGDDTRNIFPRTFNKQYIKKQEMRYGENPHQAGAFYVDNNSSSASVSSAIQIQGKALSYNNIADTDAALECVKQFGEMPCCVIVKHANPCGVAVAENQMVAYQRAYSTDPESAFGGIIAFNTALAEDTAKLIIEQQFVEVIIAPVISREAKILLQPKQNIRVLESGNWQQGDLQQSDLHGVNSFEIKRVNGGLLVQELDNQLYHNLQVVTERQPGDQEMSDLLFAWQVAKFVKSNAIIYAHKQMTIGVGAGQMSRVNSARIAAIKAEHAGLSVEGAVMASDAFFPFRDGLDNAASVGIRAVIQPGGSMRDEEVIAAANQHDITMIFTGMRHFRH